MNPPMAQTGLAASVPLVATSSQAAVMEGLAVAAVETPKPPPRVYSIYSWRTKAPNARLVYIRNHTTADEEIANFKPGLVGFDLEWRPTFIKGKPENPVSLIQLANEDTVLLLQVTAMRKFPDRLRALLLNPAYVKAGVGIQNDTKKLWADWRVSTRNCVDLSLLARTVDNAHWKGKYTNPIGLARLCETYEDLTLTKGKITRSNWEAILTLAQQEYAANDCHSGLTLFKRLLAMTETMDPAPLPSFYSFDLFEGYLYQASTAPRPGTLWHPLNPRYDPGPPPPPKPAKDKANPEGSSENTAESSTSRGTTGTEEDANRKRLQPSESLAGAPRPKGGRGRMPGNQLASSSDFASRPQHVFAQQREMYHQSGEGRSRGGRPRHGRRGDGPPDSSRVPPRFAPN